MRSEFTAAALAGLAANGEPSDANIARAYLNHESDAVITEVVRILDRFGDDSDSQPLASLAAGRWGELQQMTGRAALKLGPGTDGAALHLLRSEKPKLVALAVRSLLNEDRDKVGSLVEPLLDSEDAAIRLNVLSFFLKRYEDNELEKLLQRYSEK